MTPLDRRKMLHKMGLVGPLPTVHDQRRWALIDDRIPPPGEADGEFSTHLQWIHKASSWIGFTGAKCFDALDRPCRIGGDMARARDEDAFPVRWYWPDRFDEPLPELKPVAMAVLRQLHEAPETRLPADQILSHTGKAKVRKSVLSAMTDAGYIEPVEEGYALTSYGQDQYPYEAQRIHRLRCIRRYR